MASELLSKFDQIINYLKGTNINLDGLNVSTVDLLKSCSGILSIASIFVNVDSEVVVGSLVGLGSLSLDLIFGVVILPVVFFLGMDVVGEPDGYVDNYWKTHNITDSQGIPVTEVNQINLNHPQNMGDYVGNDEWYFHPQNRAPGFGHGITEAFVVSNSGPDDGDNSFIVKVLAISTIVMISSPYALFAISGIYKYLNKFSNNTNMTYEFKVKTNPY